MYISQDLQAIELSSKFKTLFKMFSICQTILRKNIKKVLKCREFVMKF